MNSKRVKEIMENKEILDVYFQDNPVWVQELKENTAKIGFLDGKTQDVYIEDLYEKERYNSNI